MGLLGLPDIEKMKARRDVRGLIRALGYQKDAAVCPAAASALGWIDDARAVEPLIAALKNRDSGVLAAVARALG
jgi:HEAT repeat protein